MSVNTNNWKNKRFVQKTPHNRKPGHALFWKQSRNRKARRWNNRINDWRIAGKLATEFDNVGQKNERTFTEPPRFEYTIHKFEDFLKPEDKELLARFYKPRH